MSQVSKELLKMIPALDGLAGNPVAEAATKLLITVVEWGMRAVPAPVADSGPAILAAIGGVLGVNLKGFQNPVDVATGAIREIATVAAQREALLKEMSARLAEAERIGKHLGEQHAKCSQELMDLNRKYNELYTTRAAELGKLDEMQRSLDAFAHVACNEIDAMLESLGLRHTGERTAHAHQNIVAALGKIRSAITTGAWRTNAIHALFGDDYSPASCTWSDAALRQGVKRNASRFRDLLARIREMAKGDE